MLVAIGIASTIDGTSGQGLLHEHRQQNPHTEDETVTPMSDFDEEAGRGAAPWLCCCAGKVSCSALPCPALPLLMLGNNNCGGDWHYSFCSCCELPCLLALPLGNPVKPYSDPHIADFLWPKHAWSFVLVLFLAQYTW